MKILILKLIHNNRDYFIVFQAGWPEAKIVATKRGQEGLRRSKKNRPS
jgi:hypothetical protein